jgi:hypothetical protein
MEIATSRMEAQNSLVIKLQPATVLLKEVAIKGNGYAAEVIAKAYKKALNENQYSSNGKAFFRQKSQINGEYTELLEAFYFVEYSNQGISNWIIEQGRYARKKADEGNKIIEFQNFSSMTRGLKTYSTKPGDILIPVIPKATEFYGFELKNISHQGGLEIVEIFCRPLQTVQQPGFTGSVFIETNGLQIVKLKGDVFFGSEGIELTQGFKAEDFNLEIEMAYVLDQNNGLPVLDYINANASFKYADNNNNENHDANCLFFLCL